MHVHVCNAFSFSLSLSLSLQILNWQAGPDPPLKLIPRETPLVLKREVPSIFTRGRQEGELDMPEDEMETDNAELEPDIEGFHGDGDEEMDIDGDTSIDLLETSFCENLEVHVLT